MTLHEDHKSRTLVAAHIIIAPCHSDHVDWLHQLWTDPEVRRYLWDDAVIPRTTVEELVQWSERAFLKHGWGIWLCQDAATALPIGFAGIRPTGEGGPLEILYGIAPPHWGKGYASEAAWAMLDYGFGALGQEVLIGDTDTPNVASARVMEKIGMTCEGEMVRHGLPTLRYYMTRATWKRLRSQI